MVEEMHPNWQALASVSFPYKRFVKASNFREEELKADEANEDVTNKANTGEEVMNFYNKLISEEKVKTEPTVKHELIKKEVKEEIIIDDASDDDICIVDPRTGQKLLAAAQNGDLSEIKRQLKSGADVNVTDEFGWSPLMISAAEGHEDVVKFLLDRCANIHIQDKSGRNAAAIARAKAKFEIEEILLGHGKVRPNSKNKDDQEHKGIFESCDICGEIYSTEMKKEHQSSLVHQMELDKLQDEGNPGFLISETNRGYQLMRKGGWDGHSGLGGHNEGRLFPVKSVLKADREGFKEGALKSAKVTHFTANDEHSVATRIQKKKKPARNPKAEVRIRESLKDL